MASADTTWAPDSWREHEALHQPPWPDELRLAAVRERLRAMPPLVFAGEARTLRAQLGEVAGGRAFLLQAGDCAESFHDFSAITIREKLQIFLQMSVVMIYGSGLPLVKVGRIAGQFAKPRSSPTERVGDSELLTFRGHIVHGDAFDADARRPDPERMLQAYHQAAATLNLLRAYTKGGFADMSAVHTWNQAFVTSSPQGRRYERIAGDIGRALRFMAACGIDLAREQQLHQVDVFTSHEALLLDFEEPLTRLDSLTGDWYDCSAHLPWIGERTRSPEGAHVAFLSGVHNPVACKVGPTATPDEVVSLCERLDPDRSPGRLTFIARMGAARLPDLLPPLIAAVRDAGHPVVWACDPMHANTVTTASGHKTRHFEDVIGEVETFFATCREAGAWPGGIHIEFTGEDVTECMGGSEEVLEEQISHRYDTLCDPRLNARQSLDLAFRVAELMHR